MAVLLPQLNSKHEIDDAIKATEDRVVVLRFGRISDAECLKLDDILYKGSPELANMARIFAVDIDMASVYARYFDISLIPATLFFFNAQHMKVDWGTPDHTKFIGSFRTKQDLIDVVETIFRAAMKGKLIVRSPLDPAQVPKYELIYRAI